MLYPKKRILNGRLTGRTLRLKDNTYTVRTTDTPDNCLFFDVYLIRITSPF